MEKANCHWLFKLQHYPGSILENNMRGETFYTRRHTPLTKVSGRKKETYENDQLRISACRACNSRHQCCPPNAIPRRSASCGDYRFCGRPPLLRECQWSHRDDQRCTGREPG